jgi:hypothetical protein
MKFVDLKLQGLKHSLISMIALANQNVAAYNQLNIAWRVFGK